MPYILPIPTNIRQIEHYAHYGPLFTPEECAQIIAMGDDKWQAATTSGGDTTNKRRSEVTWLRWNTEQDWVWNRLSGLITDYNRQFFGFDLTAMGEDLQLTKYDSANKGHYGWHVDVGSGEMVIRKLSVVVQLTNPAEYEGGKLEIFAAQEDSLPEPPNAQGTAILFPSFEPHRVTPLESGVRHSLVGWVSGPPYR